MTFTLRELLERVNLSMVYEYIHKKDCENEYRKNTPVIKQVIDAYSSVVTELLSKPKVNPYYMSWLVKKEKDFFDKTPYIDVCFLNPKYVAPKKGLKPWGCEKGEKPPPGHYDCNCGKHNRTYAAGFVPWSKIIDTPVIIKNNISYIQAVAELLWELTFYGWTEKKVNVNVKEIEVKLDKAKKEIDEGKCVVIPPKKKGDNKIIIANSVMKDLNEILTKKKK